MLKLKPRQSLAPYSRQTPKNEEKKKVAKCALRSGRKLRPCAMQDAR